MYRKHSKKLRRVKQLKMAKIIEEHSIRLSHLKENCIMKSDNVPAGYDLEIVIKTATMIPHQSHDYDCAAFMLQFIKYTTLQRPFNFSCLDITNLREDMKEEIIHHKINNTLQNPIRLTSETKTTATKEKNIKTKQVANEPAHKKPKNARKTNIAKPKHLPETTNFILRFSNPARQNLCFSNSVTTALLNNENFREILSQNEQV